MSLKLRRIQGTTSLTDVDLTKDTTTGTRLKKVKRFTKTFRSGANVKINPGDKQTNTLVLLVTTRVNDTEIVELHIHNAYALGLIEVISNEPGAELKTKSTKVIILQDNNGDLFLSPQDNGRVLTATYTKGQIRTYRSSAAYINRGEQLIDFSITNKYEYAVSTELEDFTYQINDDEVSIERGYKLTRTRDYNEEYKNLNGEYPDYLKEKLAENTTTDTSATENNVETDTNSASTADIFA